MSFGSIPTLLFLAEGRWVCSFVVVVVLLLLPGFLVFPEVNGLLCVFFFFFFFLVFHELLSFVSFVGLFYFSFCCMHFHSGEYYPSFLQKQKSTEVLSSFVPVLSSFF
jgi:hypothetical protein